MTSIYSNFPLKSHLVHSVYYEDLQVNQQNALTAMLTAIGLTPEEAQEMAAEVRTSLLSLGNLLKFFAHLLLTYLLLTIYTINIPS